MTSPSIKDPAPDDLHYILKTTLRCQSGEEGRGLPAQPFFAMQTDLWLEVLRVSRTRLIAEDDKIVSFLTYSEEPVRAALFIYTRSEHRRKGHARALIKDAFGAKGGTIFLGCKGPNFFKDFVEDTLGAMPSYRPVLPYIIGASAWKK